MIFFVTGLDKLTDKQTDRQRDTQTFLRKYYLRLGCSLVTSDPAMAVKNIHKAKYLCMYIEYVFP